MPNIEIEQVDSNLTAHAGVHRLITIDSKIKCSFSFDAPRENRCFFLEEKFANFDGSLTYRGNNHFDLNLFAQIPKKNRSQLHNDNSLYLFKKYNIEIDKVRSKLENFEGIIVNYNKVEMKLKGDFGFVQFCCYPKFLYLDGSAYGDEEIITYFFFKNRKVYEKIVQPALITHTMSYKDNFDCLAALLPGQRFQLVLPSNIEVNPSDLDSFDYSVLNKKLLDGTSIGIHEFVCKKRLIKKEEHLYVFLPHSNYRKICGVRFLPIYESHIQELYLRLNEEEQNLLLFCNQYIAGIMLNKPESVSKYVTADNDIQLEKRHQSLYLRFQKPFKYVSIEHDKGVYLIEGNPTCLSADRLP